MPPTHIPNIAIGRNHVEVREAAVSDLEYRISYAVSLFAIKKLIHQNCTKISRNVNHNKTQLKSFMRLVCTVSEKFNTEYSRNVAHTTLR